MPFPDPEAEERSRQRQLDRGPHQEALSWLEVGGGRHTLGIHESAEESLALARAAYAAGALEVRATRIDTYEDDGAQNTGHLIITLPDDQEARARVLAWAAPFHEAQGFDSEPDRGERYWFVRLD